MHHQLYIHDRNRIVRPLDERAVKALEAVFREQAARGQAIAAAVSVRDLADHRYWLACGCTQELNNPPILFPRRTKHTVSLVRATGRASHRQGCPFSRGKFEVQTPREEREQGVAHANTPMAKPWHIGGKPRRDVDLVQRGGDESERVATRHGKRMPKLGRLMMTLLQEAGLDTVRPESIEKVTYGKDESRKVILRLSKAAAYQRLEALGNEITADGMALGETVCLVPRLLYRDLGRARAALKPRQTATRYLLVMADRVEGDHLYYQSAGKEAKLKLGSRPRMFGVEDGTQGPYWSLVRFSIKHGTRFSEAVETYMHPAVSRGVPIPVDSRLERYYLKRLLEQVVYWRDKPKNPVAVTLWKPLFDAMVDDEPCRPDVILQPEHGERLIVEVMGMKDHPDYMASKSVTHHRMRRLGNIHDLLEVDADTEWDHFRKELTGNVYAAIRAKAGE